MTDSVKFKDMPYERPDLETVKAEYARLAQALASAETLEAAEAAGRPSVTVVRAGGTDSLWSLAKRCHSTTAAIAEQNELDPSATIAGRVLLIPAVRQ